MANWLERAKQNFQKGSDCNTDVTDERPLSSVVSVPQTGTSALSGVSTARAPDAECQEMEPDALIEHADGSRPIDPVLFIDVACRDLPITRDWVHQFVICEEDIEDIRKGDLPLACLRAHIEYHLEEQRKWQERRKEINRGTRASV